MNYVKEKVEAVKVLFLEILEANEQFKKRNAEKEIQFELNGGDFPDIVVRFWNWEAKNNPEEVFEIPLDERNRAGRRYNLEALSEKVSKWRENFGNS